MDTDKLRYCEECKAMIGYKNILTSKRKQNPYLLLCAECLAKHRGTLAKIIREMRAVKRHNERIDIEGFLVDSISP